MIESDAVAKMRKVDGIGCFLGKQVDGLVDWRGKAETNIVQRLVGSIAGARDEGELGCFDLDVGVAKHFDRAIGKEGRAVVVTDFADG